MAGAGYKLFVNGNTLSASDLNTYVQQQTVMVFASASARTTALSGVLSEGMVSYRLDSHVLEVYNGTIWEATETVLTTKGDLVAFDTAPTRLPVGSNAQVLTADSTQATGIKWATISSYSAPTIGSTSIPSGGTVTTIAGLTLTSPTISSISNTGTLTLPTATDTLVARTTTDTLTNKTLSGAILSGSLTAGGSTGSSNQLLQSTGTGVQWATVSGSKVVQIVSAITTTYLGTSSTSYVDSNLTATITPTSASNNILVFTMQQTNVNASPTSNTYMQMRLVRGSTTLITPPGAGNLALRASSGSLYITANMNMMYLDSPATTAATTYKTQVQTTASQVINLQDSSPSTIILMEVTP